MRSSWPSAAGTQQFTHASYDDYRVLKTNLAAKYGDGTRRSTTGRLIPYCVFTTPELGRVGLTEHEAREAGHNVRIARMPVTAIPRARTTGHLEGSWKAVVDRDTDRILGVALLGTEASETIAVVQMAMLAGISYTAVRDAVITHPTMSEGLTCCLLRRTSRPERRRRGALLATDARPPARNPLQRSVRMSRMLRFRPGIPPWP